ncbi:CMRF35-like molecule 8 isoform X2 [Ctenopharyngodon idella]|uniref:CMRF35-like molecule 8 isoform X2 n=1 Tax=Ctenopharyngodon idella TaxID=7959 RepID=UPI0022303052|nr:CMRF35-like molecule 8 isoform X2 [Ctenopharyngodon idella]
MWDILLLFSSICTAVVVGDADTVTGYSGERVEIRCSYESGYESNSKYFCKGKCSFGNKDIMVKSGSAAKDERFSLTDDTTNRVFTVTITDLRTEDEGKYWCAVKRTLSFTDVYSEIMLQVKQVSITHLPLNTTAEITSEDSDWNDHNYQEISELQCKNKHTTTIYTTVESPDYPMIYSTADKPDDLIIYYTLDKPADQIIDSTADKPDDQ